jgi:hypothetical protein
MARLHARALSFVLKINAKPREITNITIAPSRYSYVNVGIGSSEPEKGSLKREMIGACNSVWTMNSRNPMPISINVFMKNLLSIQQSDICSIANN